MQYEVFMNLYSPTGERLVSDVLVRVRVDAGTQGFASE